MENAKEKIKEYLRVNNLSREFLCERYEVSKSAVDKWLSNQRPIPVRVLADFEKLYAEQKSDYVPDTLVLSIDPEKFSVYEKIARGCGMGVKEWLVSVIDDAAEAEGEK